MNQRVWLGGLLLAACLATLWGVWGQRSELAGLRAEQQQLLAQLAARADESRAPAATQAEGTRSGAAPSPPAATPELLRLRSEVTRLTERRRELEGVRPENARLRAQLASRGTNGSAGSRLPPGYIRKAEARMVGFNTPEDALQSFLWAIQNRDLTNLLQALAPDQSKLLQAELTQPGRSADDLFRDAGALPGIRVVGRKESARDGLLDLEVEVIPGIPPKTIRFQQINGQWRIELGL